MTVLIKGDDVGIP